mmetsp:Transcript_31822/g.93458  ORF Transcript_31822/g.93458 Transcript_31822/m.93458 type:complete len:355 (+) Transcript_31822:22-1086(+)
MTCCRRYLKTMPAVQSNHAIRPSLVLLFVLLTSWESFAFASLPSARTATSTRNGILVGGNTGVSPHGSRLHLRAPRAFSKVFRVGRGGDNGRSEFGVEAAGRVADHVVAASSPTSSGSPVSDTMLSMTGGGGDDAEGDVEAGKSDSKLGPNAPSPGILRRALPWYPWHRLPDHLTYLRCVAIPLLVALYYLPSIPNRNLINSLLFAGASITDYLDGYLARRWDITSAFGAFLDPVADKLMVSTALILLSGTWGAAVAIPSAIILAREIAVSALREWMAQRGLRDSVKVGFQGKLKTAFTMLSLTILLLVPEGADSIFDALYEPSIIMLFLSALVTVTSGSVYFKAAAPVLMGKE